MPDDLVPYEFPRRAIRKMNTEQAGMLASELGNIEVERLRMAGKASNTEYAMDRTEELATKLESKLRGTSNPIAQEAYKQYFVEFVLSAKRELGRQGRYG
jgi:hypothetical protein